MERDVYEENGYDSRDDYLNSLSEEYDVPADAVYALAEVLGPDEDFDGLVSNLEDAMYGGLFDETDSTDEADERAEGGEDDKDGDEDDERAEDDKDDDGDGDEDDERAEDDIE